MVFPFFTWCLSFAIAVLIAVSAVAVDGVSLAMLSLYSGRQGLSFGVLDFIFDYVLGAFPMVSLVKVEEHQKHVHPCRRQPCMIWSSWLITNRWLSC